MNDCHSHIIYYSMRYKINAPLVIAEKVAEEVIILNMQTGKYYSAQGLGAVIWEMLSNAYTLEEAVAEVSKQFNSIPNTLQEDISQLLTQLQEDLLLVESDVSSPIATIELSAIETYTTPEIATYTDMEALLLLDPVHEVSTKGWPQQKDSEDK